MPPQSAFQMVLGIQTLFIMLVWQALYQLRHLLTSFSNAFSQPGSLSGGHKKEEGGRKMRLGCLEKRVKIFVCKLFTLSPLESGLAHSAQQSATEQAF